MELRQLRYFVAVAEEQSFSRAAQRLFISQPPLTRQIKNLESELGVTLLDRNTRRVELTPAGHAFLRRARNTLYESETAAADARRGAEGYGEVITIGFMSVLMLAKLTPAMRELHAHAPGVDIQFRQMRSDEQWEAVIDGRLDVGLVDLGIAAMSQRLEHEKISSRIFLHEPLAAAVPKGHALAGRRKLSLGDLRNERFSILERQHHPSHYDTVVAACQASGFTPRIAFHGEQMPTVLAYVAAGMSVCIAPALAAASWSEHIAFIPLQERPFIDIHMVVKEARRTPRVRLLCDLLGAR